MIKIDYSYTREKARQAFRHIEDHLAPDAPKEQIKEDLRRTCLSIAHNQQDIIDKEKTFETA